MQMFTSFVYFVYFQYNFRFWGGTTPQKHCISRYFILSFHKLVVKTFTLKERTGSRVVCLYRTGVRTFAHSEQLEDEMKHSTVR